MKVFDLPYTSRRMPVIARRAMVATSQPLAVLAGLNVMERGGNAVDAAIAAAATLTVVEPTSNGIGGDAFALVWDGTKLHGLNGSGRAPAALSLDVARMASGGSINPQGWLPVTVPGAPRAWSDLHQRFGRLSFEDVLSPAISAAEDGFAVTPIVAHYWNQRWAHGAIRLLGKARHHGLAIYGVRVGRHGHCAASPKPTAKIFTAAN